ncbi:hypothetical protein HY440_02565 [Candidatus Microgenomates bacterium]|nr:hypothetical protein [Candidatus Microgenomates bacterium]
MDNPPSTVGPKVISLGPAPVPSAPGRKFFGLKTLFLFGGLFVLLAGLGIGTFLVQRQQSQSPQSRADNFCSNARWPADPGTACGKATQKPAEGATDTSLTPDFHWDYGGYRSGETGCVEPSGCSSYGVAVYLAEGSYADSNIIATCNMPTSSSPIKDAPWSCFNHAALKPNTDYYWVPTPYYGGIVHAEMTWRYHFKTGGNATAACQRVSSDPSDLSKTKVNDTITFTGYGVTSVETEIIDKINFIVLRDNVQLVSSESAAVRDSTKDTEFAGKAWKATYVFKVPDFGTYDVRIRVHWKNQDVWKE